MRISVTRLRSDAGPVVALDSEIFPHDAHVETAGAAWWIATVDGEPAGFGGIAPRFGSYAYLRRSGVLPRFRGQGIHTRLIRVRIAWARRCGLSTVITYTSRDNCASANNLEDLGFRLYEPRLPYVGKQFLYWRLVL